jgi:hypothetical protein
MQHTNWYFRAFLILCCSYAWWKGGGPERVGSTIFFVGVVLTRLAESEWATRWSGVENGVFAVDLGTFVALAALALTAERFWPLWLTALQLLATTGHVVKMADPTLIRWGYAFIIAIWSYPMLALIALGTWRHQRRVARFGADKSWSSFSGPSGPAHVARPIG